MGLLSQFLMGMGPCSSPCSTVFSHMQEHVLQMVLVVAERAQQTLTRGAAVWRMLQKFRKKLAVHRRGCTRIG